MADRQHTNQSTVLELTFSFRDLLSITPVLIKFRTIFACEGELAFWVTVHELTAPSIAVRSKNFSLSCGKAQAAFRRQQQERAAWEREDQRRRQQEMAALAAKQECCAPKSVAITPTSTNAAPSADTLIVLETKKSLVRMGYDPGPIDNQLNPQTVEEIKEYEVKYSLLVTGRPSQELLKHMLQHGG